MKERPILFSGPMVRAILDGRKTQTRRIVKPQPIGLWGSTGKVYGHTFSGVIEGPKDNYWVCPYGQAGTRLWVRETWMEFDEDHRISDSKLARFAYRASITRDGEEIRKEYVRCGRPYRWRPSIHMPRLASRITLEITGVKVERLQDISEKDAIAEGILPIGKSWFNYYKNAEEAFCGEGAPIVSYQSLWESINGSDSWAVNPWVWVISFRRINDVSTMQ